MNKSVVDPSLFTENVQGAVVHTLRAASLEAVGKAVAGEEKMAMGEEKIVATVCEKVGGMVAIWVQMERVQRFVLS